MKLVVDTNVLVRAVVRDDPAQARVATKVLADAELIAIALPCLRELVWVLRKVYGFQPADAVSAIRALLAAANVEMNRPAVEAGLSVLEAGERPYILYTPRRDAGYSSGAIGLGVSICSHIRNSLAQLRCRRNLIEAPANRFGDRPQTIQVRLQCGTRLVSQSVAKVDPQFAGSCLYRGKSAMFVHTLNCIENPRLPPGSVSAP